MGPPSFLPGVWELSQVVAQDKPKAKCLIGKIVAQQVSDVHNSGCKSRLDNDAPPCVSDKEDL